MRIRVFLKKLLFRKFLHNHFSKDVTSAEKLVERLLGYDLYRLRALVQILLVFANAKICCCQGYLEENFRMQLGCFRGLYQLVHGFFTDHFSLGNTRNRLFTFVECTM